MIFQSLELSTQTLAALAEFRKAKEIYMQLDRDCQDTTAAYERLNDWAGHLGDMLDKDMQEQGA